jgi:3-(3-hydroxy-phenyl)propionate hydroxylase
VAGGWRVDADRSSVTFSARGFWGVVPVTGSFAAPTGAAIVDEYGLLSGELVIPAATLSTGLALRDRHLRGHAFFDVERYPEIKFTVDRPNSSRKRHVVSGALTVRDRTVKLDLPVEIVERGPGELVIAAHAVIEREPLGLGHSPLEMIRGPVEVRVTLVLTPGESPNSADDRSPSSHPGFARAT